MGHDTVTTFAFLFVVASITASCQGCAVNQGNGSPVGWELSNRRQGVNRMRPVMPHPGNEVRPVLPSLVSKTRDFRLIDTNGDGFVTRQEWNQAFTYLLENYDTNGDSRIATSELNPPTSANSPSNIERVAPGSLTPVRRPVVDRAFDPVVFTDPRQPRRPRPHRRREMRP